VIATNRALDVTVAAGHRRIRHLAPRQVRRPGRRRGPCRHTRPWASWDHRARV